MFDLECIQEPKLRFRYGQTMEAPRDGLTLFGPLEEQPVHGIKAGVVGRPKGIERFRTWVHRIQNPIVPDEPKLDRLTFPGFEAVFNASWEEKPVVEISISPDELDETIRIADGHQRVYRTVSLYSEKIKKSILRDDASPDVWFVVVPDELYNYCRPQSRVEKDVQVETDINLNKEKAKELKKNPSLFERDNEAAKEYDYHNDFHDQLKARLLEDQAVLQIAKERTLTPEDFAEYHPRDDQNRFRAEVAWNLGTATYYKAGGRPWKTAEVRDDVCYVGLVFKRDERREDPRAACCGAQMFLDSGDGVVFKGAVGPWYNPDRGQYHLTEDGAEDLMDLVIEGYKRITNTDKPPRELFIHGRVRFNDEEWGGFENGINEETDLTGVRIIDGKFIKLFRPTDYTVLRGLAYPKNNKKEGYLWTKGFIPKTQTYPGREVPNPLFIDICRGEADIVTVMKDIMALTKLNYNTTNFAHGEPVTLKFADSIGEIMTAGPVDIPLLPFRYYI